VTELHWVLGSEKVRNLPLQGSRGDSPEIQDVHGTLIETLEWVGRKGGSEKIASGRRDGGRFLIWGAWRTKKIKKKCARVGESRKDRRGKRSEQQIWIQSVVRGPQDFFSLLDDAGSEGFHRRRGFEGRALVPGNPKLGGANEGKI